MRKTIDIRDALLDAYATPLLVGVGSISLTKIEPRRVSHPEHKVSQAYEAHDSDGRACGHVWRASYANESGQSWFVRDARNGMSPWLLKTRPQALAFLAIMHMANIVGSSTASSSTISPV